MSHTVKEALEGVAIEGVNPGILKTHGKRIPQVLDGLPAKPIPTNEGYQLLSPEQLLNVRVNVITVNGRVMGYQRDFDVSHARKIARAMRDGRPMPTLDFAIDGHGVVWAVDGQHRAAAAVMARVPVPAVIRRLTKDEQAALFFGQRRAKTVDPNVLTLSGDGPFERYVQEAVADRSGSHPWYGIVSESKRSATRIGPYAMYQLLVRYVGNLEAQAAGVRGDALDERWDRGHADALAGLIRPFGNKKTNPDAFRPFALQAIGATAMWVFRRHDPLAEDWERWPRHMPKFPWGEWNHIKRQRLMTGHLIDHWNKSLRGKRRVERPEA